jgi:polysaccharide export outer membrane protein
MPRILNFFSNCPYLLILLSVAFLLSVSSAQNSAPAQDAIHETGAQKEPSGTVGVPPGQSTGQKDPEQTDSSALVLGPGDEVDVSVYGAPDLSGHTRVSSDGNISMPLVGNIRVGGMTSSEAEGAIEAQLRQNNILNDPHVSVFARGYASSGVSVVGEVVKPGSYSTLGPHRLFDIIQAAGGLTEKAANRAIISHRGSDETTTVELPRDPAKMAVSNVDVRPGDTVVVPTAPIVYVLGEVTKPGGYVLNSTNGVTLLRVVAAAGGPTHEAAVGSTKMLRTTPSGLKQLQVPLKNIMQAKAPDMPVQAEDIIYVPRSRIKAALSPGALLTAAASVAIYRVPF